jgi:hypothetical protein
VESGQDAVIRALLYEHAHKKVKPYGITVAEFTNRFSQLRNKLGNAGVKDEGLVVVENQLKQCLVSQNENQPVASSQSFNFATWQCQYCVLMMSSYHSNQNVK